MSRTGLTLVATNARPVPHDGERVRPRLGEVLRRRGLIDEDALQRGLVRQRTMAAKLGTVLRHDTGLSEGQILDALGEQWRADAIDLSRDPPDPSLAAMVGLTWCLTHKALPWRRIGAATVVACAHPDRFDRERETLEAIFGPVMLAIASEAALGEALRRQFPAALARRAERRTHADLSCRAWQPERLQAGLAATAVATAAGLIAAPVVTWALLTCMALTVTLVLTGLKAAAALAGLRSPSHVDTNPDGSTPVLAFPGMAATDTGAGKQPVVSLLVPLFRESEIAETLIARLSRLTYPAPLLDVCLVVEDDDPVTRETLAKTPLPSWMRVIAAPAGTIRTKPRALNYALDFCLGDIVGVYDAEDNPDADQIDRVVARFADAPAEVACLQGRLGFYNPRANWLARCFAIEYASWFSVILPGWARLGFVVPLGGTTLFFRRSALEKLGAWDAHNVTEDADLGVRLARHGYRTEVIDTRTAEEATCRAWPWVRQRSRWLKGYAMTYATHMRSPRMLRQDLGSRQFWGVQALFLGTLLHALLAPVLWSLWLILLGLGHPLQGHVPGFAMALALGLMIVSEAVALSVAGLGLARERRPWLFPWALTLNFYHKLGTLAAYKALYEMMVRPYFWDKTTHGLSGVDPQERTGHIEDPHAVRAGTPAPDTEDASAPA